MDTQTQIDRLIELAIIQRSELKQLVEQLPQLREHLNAEVEKVFDETEPQLRAELEEWTTKQTADKTAALGVALEAKIADLAKSLEVSTQARYNAIIAEREENARLAAQAEAKIAEHAASLPSAVKEIVSAELARFPRAGEIDQLRKEFAEPRGLNPRGKWQAGESYNKLDLVTINGDSYTSNTDGNRTRPSRSSADWTLVAARGTGGGGGPTSLSELTTVPSDGDVLIGSGTSWVTSNLTAGAGISITVGPGAITISATDGDITLDDGTAASPSLHFTNDPDTGIYRPAANTLGISTSGVQRMYVDENGITTVGAGATFDGSVHAANGNANNPSFSFSSDQDTGFFRHQPNEIGVSLGGTQKATLTSTTFTITPNLVVSGTGSINGTSIPASKTLVVTTDKLSALASTSSSELAGVISDETGTGALVFANTPTLVTPNIGAATGTSLTVTGNVTASDAILGTSGPSVKSTLSARAPRQGLVFNGTAGATVSVPAFGTSDFSVVAVIAPNQLATATILTGSSNAFDLGYNSAGRLDINLANVSAVLQVAGAVVAGKYQVFTYTRTGGVGTLYRNGISIASGTDNSNYSAAITSIGGSVAFSTGYVFPLIYNRALSASEVVALYEAGAPAGADYNSASNTSVVTGFSNGGYTTFSGASATGFTAAAASGSNYVVNTPAGNTQPVLQVGSRVRVSFTATLTSGAAPTFGIRNNVGGDEGTFTVAAGSNSVIITMTQKSVSDGLGNAVFRSTGATSYAISNFSLTYLGLLLAPDAAQAGGGLVWYDTSGNAANITLPASGVSWNVPTSFSTAGGWTYGATTPPTLQIANTTSGLADTQTAANNVVLGTLKFGHPSDGQSDKFPSIVARFDPTDASFARATQLEFYTSSSAGNALGMTLKKSGNLLIGTTTDRSNRLHLAAAGPSYIGMGQLTSTYAGIVFGDVTLADSASGFNIAGNAANSNLVFNVNTGGSMNWRVGNANAFTLSSGSNLLIGTTIDGGQKLQVSGTAAITGAVTIGKDNSGSLDSSLTITATSDNADLVFKALTTSTKRNRIRFYNSLNDEQARIQSGGEVSNSYGNIVFSTSGASGLTTALTLDSSQRAIFSPARAASNLAVKIISSGAATNADRNFLLFGHNTAANAAVISQIDNTTTGAMSLILASGTDSTGAAAALTLDSSQNATFAGRIGLTASGTNTIYSNFIPAATGTYAGSITMQAGGGSAGYGGGLVLFGHSHATRPGWVIAGISGGSAGRFCVNSSGLGAGTDLFTVSDSGNMFIVNSTSVPSTNPSGGGFLYVESGALKYRGSSGTVTTIANA